MNRTLPPRTRRPLLAAGVLLAFATAACGGPAPDPGSPSTAAPSVSPSAPSVTPSEAPSSKSTEAPPSPAPSGDRLPIAITISGGQVTPNGQKISVPLGRTVVLSVTSDTDDEIHAHTGGDGYELEVKAGQPATGSFTLTEPGSFEVESHHLEKIIVILNVS